MRWVSPEVSLNPTRKADRPEENNSTTDYISLWSRGLLEKPTVIQTAKSFLALYRIQIFSIIFIIVLSLNSQEFPCTL
jgi:hypothetical protein